MSFVFLLTETCVPESWLPEWPRGEPLGGVFWVVGIVRVRWASNRHSIRDASGSREGLLNSTWLCENICGKLLRSTMISYTNKYAI